MTGPRSDRIVKFGDDYTKAGRVPENFHQSSLSFGASSQKNSRDEIVKVPPAPSAAAATNKPAVTSEGRNAKKRLATSTDYANAVKHYPVKLDTIKLKRYIANSNALDDGRLEEFVQNVS